MYLHRTLTIFPVRGGEGGPPPSLYILAAKYVALIIKNSCDFS